jgi:hypothetical protein
MKRKPASQHEPWRASLNGKPCAIVTTTTMEGHGDPVHGR